MFDKFVVCFVAFVRLRYLALRRCVDKADCLEFCQSEKTIWPHPKSLSALSLFVNLGNSEESLSSVCSAATLALLCFAIDPRQSDIHTTLAFSKITFPAIKDLIIFFYKVDTYAKNDKHILILMLIKVWKSLGWSHKKVEGVRDDNYTCHNKVELRREKGSWIWSLNQLAILSLVKLVLIRVLLILCWCYYADADVGLGLNFTWQDNSWL